MKIEDVKVGMKVKILPSAAIGKTKNYFGFYSAEMAHLLDGPQVVDSFMPTWRPQGVYVSGYAFHPEDLEPVMFPQPESQYPNPPHKHRDLIIAWANGAEIEKLDADGDWVYNTRQPLWFLSAEYRIKPAKPPDPPKPEWIKVDGVRPAGIHDGTRVEWVSGYSKVRVTEIQKLNFREGGGVDEVQFIKIVD